jgi:hypothetical protein
MSKATYQTVRCHNPDHIKTIYRIDNLHYYKNKTVPLHAMKAYRSRRGIAPFILILGSVEFSGQLHDQAALLNPPPSLPGKAPQYQLNSSHTSAPCVLEKRKICCPYRNSNPGSCSLLAMPITLPRLYTTQRSNLQQNLINNNFKNLNIKTADASGRAV